MHKQTGKLVFWSGVLAASLLIAPVAVLAAPPAQSTPAAGAAAHNGINRVALTLAPHITLAPGSASLLAAEPAVEEAETGETESGETATEEALPTPTPQAEDGVEPAATPEAEAEEAEPTPVAEEETETSEANPEEETPPVDFATVEKVQYNNEGISLQAPVDWDVSIGEFGSLFNILIPDGDFIGTMESLNAEDFPGVLAVVLFRSLAEQFVQEFDPTAELVSVDALATGQQLPILKIIFDAEFEGEPGRGGVYVVSPGSDAYMLIGYSTTDEWAALEPGVDMMAESIFFDPELITLTAAEAGPLELSDEGETLQIVVPEGWQVTQTPDDTFPLVVVDPEFRLASAVGAVAGAPEEEGIDLQALLDVGDGEADPAVMEALVQTIIAGMELSADEFQIDDTLTQITPHDDAATIRLAGDAQFEEGLSAPIVLYMDIRPDGVVAVVIFGDIALALEQEDAVLGMVQTAQILQTPEE